MPSLRRRFPRSVGSLARLARDRVRDGRSRWRPRSSVACCRRGGHPGPAVSWPSKARSAAERRDAGRSASSLKSSCRWSCCSSPAAFCRRSLRLQATDPGFAVAGRLYAYIFIPSPPFTSERRREFYAQAAETIAGHCQAFGAAALTYSLPLMPAGSDCASLFAGPQIPITTSAVDIGYFDTMRIGIVAGRDFAASDLSRGASTVAVILNESLARSFWPDKPAIGERADASDATRPQAGSRGRRRARFRDPRPGRAAHNRICIVPSTAQYHGGLTAILLETGTDPAAMVQPVRRHAAWAGTRDPCLHRAAARHARRAVATLTFDGGPPSSPASVCWRCCSRPSGSTA